MNRPLFVHPDPQCLKRLTLESDEFAMVTSSMVQALQWIMNPQVRLSGVFIHPDDATFSAFRFLELTLIHRPALPVFLFEPQLAAQPEAKQSVMNKTNIKGIFSGTEPYSTLVNSLKNNLDSEAVVRSKAPDALQHVGHIASPTSDFFTGTSYPYTLFIFNDQGKPMLFAEPETSIDPAYLSQVIQKSEYLYAKEDEIQRSKNALKETHSKFMNDEAFPKGWKTAEVMVNAKNILNEMKKSGVSEPLVEYTQEMLQDLFKLIANIETDQGSLHNLIEHAKQCDRSVFCASYAMLLCKQLRFEKTATLEILGLSSMLQDLSLYQTPLGDLSEKLPKDLSSEEMMIYLQHPTLSADLMAHHTDVPQVTLQAVRQHHERKDKTGFPHRVGGAQLHPMAEILSLINSYYEISKSGNEDAANIQELNQAVFPHYSENIVVAFKHVLGNILKDKIHTRL